MNKSGKKWKDKWKNEWMNEWILMSENVGTNELRGKRIR